jgi:hypothetical protein
MGQPIDPGALATARPFIAVLFRLSIAFAIGLELISRP